MEQRLIDLARTMRDLGMWRFVSEEEAGAAQRKVAEGGYPFSAATDEPDGDWFHIDAEEMAEGQIRYQLQDMLPRLRELGVDLVAEMLDPDLENGDAVVVINGRRCVLWSPGDWETGLPWLTSTIRPLAVINDLLAEAGAIERVFLLRDGVVWLLDPRIVEAVAASGAITDQHTFPILPGADGWR